MVWFILAIVVVALVFGPSLWVRWVMSRHSTELPGMPGTGGELAEHLLEKFGIAAGVEVTESGDHYDPANKMVRLSQQNFSGKSLTAVAVAAHEVGHAIQDHEQDKNLRFRTSLIPVAEKIARVSSGALWVAPIIGIITRHPAPLSLFIILGLGGLVARMLVHLVTLPTEFDASFAKALPVLRDGNYIAPDEEVIVARILRAAAMTYVASALADVLNLARWAALLLRR